MKKRFLKLAMLSCCSLLLASCDSEIINLPSDKDDPIVTIDKDDNNEVTDNTKEDIYNSIESSIDKNEVQLNNILYDLAKEQYLVDDFAIDTDTLNQRLHEKMMESARNSSYTTDYEFDEFKFALTLVQDRYTIKTKDGKTDLESLKAVAFKGVVTPESEFEDVFNLDYSDYFTRNLTPEIYRQYLIAYYIYNQSYSSIGTTNARNVTAVKITERTDLPGQGIKLINAFYNEFINNKAATPEQADLKHLTTLWKGVNLSEEDQAFLEKYNISTLADQIEEEVKKITDNEYTTNSSLEEEYTGSYTYPVSWGKTLAERELQQQEIYFEDTYLSSDGLSDLPDALRTRVFSTNYSTDTEAIENGTRRDYSFIITHNDGNMYRYTTPEYTTAGVNPIATYDSSTSSYYIVQLHSIVTTSRITQNASDSDEVKDEKRALAMETAYEMAAQDTYKTSAITYFLTNNTIDYSDPDFYDYIDSTYPDVFED